MIRVWRLVPGRHGPVVVPVGAEDALAELGLAADEVPAAMAEAEVAAPGRVAQAPAAEPPAGRERRVTARQYRRAAAGWVTVSQD